MIQDKKDSRSFERALSDAKTKEAKLWIKYESSKRVGTKEEEQDIKEQYDQACSYVELLMKDDRKNGS